MLDSAKLIALALRSLALEPNDFGGRFRLGGGLLGGGEEAVESLAGLIDGLLGKITDFGGNFEVEIGHGISPFGFARAIQIRPRASQLWRRIYSEEFLAPQHIIVQCSKNL